MELIRGRFSRKYINCFEWNISWPGTVLYQYTNGPLYGDKTEDVFSFLQDENNRFNYIPYYMRLRSK